MLLNTCLTSMTNMLLSLQRRPLSNIAFVRKSHYRLNCLIKELGIDNSLGNPIYTSTILTKRKPWTTIVCFFGISTQDEDEELDLQLLYQIPKLHKNSILLLVCHMLHETSFPIINIYSIGDRNWDSDLLCHYSNSKGSVNQMDSEEF